MRPSSTRRFRWLLRLLPAEMREEHGAEMRQVLEDQRRDVGDGRRARVRFWLFALTDVLRAAPRQHGEALVRDVRYAARSLRRSPSFTAAALLTIALGTGATSAVFAVVNAVLLRPLPYTDPSRLGLVWAVDDAGVRTWLSAPELERLQQAATLLDGVAGLTDLHLNLTGEGVPEELSVVGTTSSLPAVLGMRPHIGRYFEDAEDRTGAPNVVVLGYGLWTRRFGGSPSVLGRTVTLDGRGYTVIGVLPASFGILPPSSVFPQRVDAWVPLQPHLQGRGPNLRNIHAIARVRADASFGAVGSELGRIAATVERPPDDGRQWTLQIVSMHADLVREVRGPLIVLFAIVGVVLLLASANVAALLMARGESRRREMAIRFALGASRARVVRQLLTEGVVLALAGAAGGLAVAALTPLITSRGVLTTLPRFADVSIDWRVMLFALGVAVITALIFALAPALNLSARTAARAQEVLRSASRSPKAVRAGRVLAGGEIALASMVLVVALLLARGFAGLMEIDRGFSVDNVLSMRISLSPRYPDAAAVTRFFDAVLERVQQGADIESAAAVTQLPLSGAMLGSTFTAGVDPSGRERRADGDLRGVTPGYFRTLGIDVIQGRGISSTDIAASAPVAVIDETMARRLFGDRSPIGRRIRWFRQPDRDIEIVGVVRAVRHRGPGQPPRETVYRPHTQYARWNMFLVVRTRGEPSRSAAAVAAAVQTVDPDQPIADVTTMDALAARSLAQPGFGAALGSALGALALALAVVGVYGLLAFAVSQRRREVGIRLAVGASPARVARLVMTEGLLIAAGGIGVGLAGAAVLTRWLSASIAGAASPDAMTFAVSGAIVLAAAAGACALPALRAARMSPTAVLRAE